MRWNELAIAALLALAPAAGCDDGGDADGDGDLDGDGDADSDADGDGDADSDGDSDSDSDSDAARPFPQHEVYAEGTIRPDHLSQSELDLQVMDSFDAWRAAYLRLSERRGYYVAFETPCEERLTVSEAHGYGMIITALMAGYDPDARTVFDGMVDFSNDHRGSLDDDLMDWSVGCDEALGGDDDAATDGDLDIAYALLLAHDQWGSGGEVNYLGDARRIIAEGIRQSLVDPTTHSLRLGDWDDSPYDTRSSDWMADHARVFGEADDGAFWGAVVERIYSNIDHLQAVHSPSSGLMPDFVVGEAVDPAPPHFLEDEHDGDYYYNACRWPWRTAMDFAHNGEPRAHEAVDRVMTWLEAETSGDPDLIMAGYGLDGVAFADWNDSAFTAPFAAGAVVDASHQELLNTLWDHLLEMDQGEYYGDTLRLLCQLFVSGNWWRPTP